MAYTYPVLGASIATAGLSKLVGSPSYRSLVADLGWSDTALQKIGGAEVLGGLLMVFKPTRRLGGAIVIAASAPVLFAELSHKEMKLAAPRTGLLLGALSALVAP